jgi:hypothetical protein
VIVLAVIAAAGIFVFLGQIFAQEPPPPEPGMEPGMMPGMEGMGMGMGAAGGNLEWTEQPMPEELTMTYDEFVARTGAQRAAIPDVFLTDEEGKPRKYTQNQWAQLQRIYAGRREGAAAAPVAGTPGYQLSVRLNREMGVKQKELDAVNWLYRVGLDSFSFEIGYPQVQHANVRPGATAIPIEVGVIMKVKPGIAQRYPSLVYKKLKPFDNYGLDRELFRIVDYEGGMWNPKQVYLWNGAVAEWNRLWAANVVQLTLYDVEGRRLVTGTQPAGHTGGICAKLVYPDELNYAPLYETVIPPRDHSFEGGRLNLAYKKGWYYNFSFTIPMAQLASLERAEAVLIGAAGVEGSRSATQAAPPETTFEGGSSRAAAQAGAEQAMSTARTSLPMMQMQVAPGFY